jgi:hypothetical protein
MIEEKEKTSVLFVCMGINVLCQQKQEDNWFRHKSGYKLLQQFRPLPLEGGLTFISVQPNCATIN